MLLPVCELTDAELVQPVVVKFSVEPVEAFAEASRETGL